MALNMTLDPMALLKADIEAANLIGRKIQAATSDVDASISAIIASSDDEKIVGYRDNVAKVQEQIATLQAKLTNGEANVKEYARTLVPGVDPTFDPEAAKKEFISLRAAAHKRRQALEAVFGEDAIKQAMEEEKIVEVISLKGTGVAKAAGSTGIKRPRIATATVNGEKVAKPDGKVDFTFLGKSLGTDADALKALAFTAAGTDDLNSLTAGTEVSFSVTVGDKTSAVVVTVSDVKPGRKAAEKPAEVVASEVTAEVAAE